MNGLIAYAASKKYTDSVIQEIVDVGFKVQVEQDRSILSGTGQRMTLYLIPKMTSLSGDAYDEYLYTTGWEKVGSTEIDDSSEIKSAIVNQNGTISFYNKNGDLLFTTTGASVIGPPYILTEQDKQAIADIVLESLPTTEGVLYGN